MPDIVTAKTQDHMEDFRVLVREFVSWAVATFHPGQTAPPKVIAKLDQELADLPGKYEAPKGCQFIA